jgi:outer membrane protein assembly factor BamA
MMHVLLLLVAGATLRAGADEPEVSCRLPDEVLEGSEARIGEITINALDIFDLDDPEDDKALFRLMNKLHVRTRDPVIKRQLLFDTDEPFSRQKLDESERILRQTAYLYDAEIRVTSCDAETVDVDVTTRDVWTLKPGIDISRSGGESRVGLDLQEENFLGRGGSIRFLLRNDEERRSTEIGYADRNIGGRWISLNTTIADNSDGHVFALGLQRPFYSLDTRWAVGGRVRDERRDDKVYVLGDEIGKFRTDIEHFDVYGGWSAGLRAGWVQRWLGGFVYDDQAFSNANDSLDPDLVPENRRLAYPYVEYQLIEDRFQRAENLDQIQRTEDVALGAEVSVRLGWLAETLGADRSGAVFSAVARRGYGDPARMLWDFSTYASGRVESGKVRDAVIGGSAVWYLRQSDRRLLFASLRGDVARELDLDNPLEIGGDNGLRGYPLRYQRGDARAQFTIEQRYFTDYYLWRLLRVGGAIFFDAGRVWGDNPFGGENLGWLRDVGFGLRLASTRSSIGKMIHIDFAFPLDGDSSISSFQFLVSGKRSF